MSTERSHRVVAGTSAQVHRNPESMLPNSQGYYTRRDKRLEYTRPMALHHRRGGVESHVSKIAYQRVLAPRSSFLEVPNPEYVLSNSALQLPPHHWHHLGTTMAGRTPLEV